MKKRNRISSLLTCRLHLISRRWLEYYSPNINSCILSHFLDEMLCVHSFFFMTLFQLVRWVLLQTKLSVTARNENKYLSRSKKKCGIPVEKTSVCAILTTHEAPIKKKIISSFCLDGYLFCAILTQLFGCIVWNGPCFTW
jgi:hypothetical protein